MTNPNSQRTGFTLIELLIVAAIIVIVMAVMIFLINSRLQGWKESNARLQIKNLEGHLIQYSVENRGYPTTEQGLYALIFHPDNAGGVRLPNQQLQQPAGQVSPDGGMFDPNLGGSGSIGSDMFNQPNMMNPNMGFDPMNPNPGFDPTNPMNPNPGFDPNIGGSGVIGGQAMAWNQPFYNPQLYQRQQRRSAPKIRESDLLDPWGNPYRYDNSRGYNGLNATGTEMPAVWSAGADGIDGTPDDILGWDPIEAEDLINAHQQRMQQQGQGWGTQPNQGFDMMNPNPMFDPSNPMGNQGFDPTNNPFGQPPTGGPPTGPTGFPPIGPTGGPPTGPTGFPPTGPTGGPPTGPTGFPPTGPSF